MHYAMTGTLGPLDPPLAAFGWVFAGNGICTHRVTPHHAFLTTGDDLIRQVWVVEEISIYPLNC